MKVRALTNIKRDGWHHAGEVFEIHDDAYGDLKGLVERVEESTPPKDPDMNPHEEPAAKEEKPKRTAARKRRE